MGGEIHEEGGARLSIWRRRWWWERGERCVQGLDWNREDV